MTRPCHLCLGPCEPSIHAATKSLRKWLRARVRAYLTPVSIGPRGSRQQRDIEAIGLVPKRVPRATPARSNKNAK